MQASESETNLALAHPQKIYHSWGVAKLLLGIMLSAHSLLLPLTSPPPPPCRDISGNHRVDLFMGPQS